MNYFITAIGTDSGKTLVSAIFCQALKADYWKPVQAGTPRDTDTVRQLISNPKTVLHPEQYLLSRPMSPHAAAPLDQITINLSSFKIPETDNMLIIEGAGGCLVPLNDEDFVIDLVSACKAEVVVVSNHYLGSINHTLLTLEALRRRRLSIKGLVFNGESDHETERIILQHGKMKCLLRIQKESEITAQIVKKYASILNSNLHG